MGETLIKSLSASSDATLSFIDGASDVVFDDTYSVYEFHFMNMHPQTSSDFKFQVNATDDAGGGYDTSLITSTHFRTWHREDESETSFDYSDGHDQGQAAGYQIIINGVDNAADSGCSGVLTIYDPSSTAFVKHFTSRASAINGTDYSQQSFSAGYINDTTAIDEISFKFNSGNIDAGTIKMFGVS
jgi:hypothetical protein